ETTEAALLSDGIVGWGPGRFGFEHRMKLFVRSILFRVAQCDPLRDDAEADPPDRQPRQAAQSGAGKRATVVAANALRQAVLGERALETPPGGRVGRPRQGVAPQHESAESV